MDAEGINPRDLIIIKNLAALEEAGEQGFSAYNSGNTVAGKQQIKQVMDDSAANIRKLKDPALQKEAQTLLNATNQAIREYIRHPTDDNLDTLKNDVDAYKDFLDSHRS